MADAGDQDLDAFLGVRTVPAWRRYAKWALVALGVVLLVLLAMRLFRSDPPAGYASEAARRGDLRVTVSATGKLAPTNQVTVGSQLSGLVTRVVADVNDRVTAGQPLALIDPEQLEDQIRANRATLAANQAQVAQAQATVAEANAQLARLQEVFRLSGGRVPSATELQTGRANAQRAVAGLRVAQANVTAGEAQLAQSQTQRARAIIRSPVSGVVLARQVEPGQTVASSFNTPTLFVIAEDLTKMELQVAIDEADVGEVRQGQRATFTVDAFPGRTFPATIARVDLGSNLSATTTATTTGTTATVVSYAATLTVANPTGQLRPGMTATADIVTSEIANVLLVPNAALRFRPTTGGSGQGGIAGALVMRGPRRGGNATRSVTVGRGAAQTVYVAAGGSAGEGGQPQPVRITTGDTDGAVTEVLSGDLRPGMRVVTGQLNTGGSGGSAGGGGRRRGGGSGGGGQRGGQ